jgi:S-layer family protein
MNENWRMASKVTLLITVLAVVLVLSARLRADTGTCGGVNVALPFTDVPSSNIFFCSIAAAYFSGLTNGTSATTYGPGNNVTRDQMAAFITRTLDQSLRRGSRRAALNQWATPSSVPTTGRTTVGDDPALVACDGTDLWVANSGSDTVSRVRASDGKLLQTWTGATNAIGVVVARGRVFVTGHTSPGKLYVIDGAQPPGPVTTLADDLGDFGGLGVAFAGYYIWTISSNSVSRVDPNTGAVTNYTAGFSAPYGITYDGSNIWVTDIGDDTIKKLNSNGTIAYTISAGSNPFGLVFDGMNLWVPHIDISKVSVVRVKDAAGNPLNDPLVLATLTGNGLSSPYVAAFDGERILVTNISGGSVSLWKASDLTPLGFATGADGIYGACSDGLNFWITLNTSPLGTSPGKLVRF